MLKNSQLFKSNEKFTMIVPNTVEANIANADFIARKGNKWAVQHKDGSVSESVCKMPKEFLGRFLFEAEFIRTMASITERSR